jgi:hypothetical protein
MRVLQACHVHVAEHEMHVAADRTSWQHARTLSASRSQERLDGVRAEFETSLEEDDALLAAAAGEPGALADWPRVAAQYRRERKRLAAAAGTILDIYDRLARGE